MKILYGVIPTLIILLIIISNPLESEAQALESRYAFDIYLVFDKVNIQDAKDVKQAFKNKSETYPLREHFVDWVQSTGTNESNNEFAALKASFVFESKNQCIEFYNWIINNIPQDIRDNIIYGRVLVTENTHHYPDDQILPDVIVFERIIGDVQNAVFMP